MSKKEDGMKKLVVLSSVFVFVFAFSVGMSLMLAENSEAIWLCEFQCTGSFQCTFDTGPNCTNPNWPYYVYFKPTCGGGPLNCPGTKYWVACWDGVHCWIPEQEP